MSSKILRNMARCKKCGDTIESKFRWDYRRCTCGAIAVDGGRDYLKRAFQADADAEIEELSTFTKD